MHAESVSMLSVYWPTGLCATSINKLTILMLAVLPCEGSVHVSIINWKLQKGNEMLTVSLARWLSMSYLNHGLVSHRFGSAQEHTS